MMKASELRIGNCVNTPNPNMNPFIIEAIENHKVGGQNGIGSFVYWGYDNINPIPLTEEWLVKMGFKAYLSGYKLANTLPYTEVKIDKKGFYTDKQLFSYELSYTKGRTRLYQSVFHLHQLQNLYYALTGEELTIKEL